MLDTRKDKTIPSEFIVKLLDCILKYNIFEFDGQLYKKLIGTAMGSKIGPSVADIFCSFLDEEIRRRAFAYGDLLFYKRFLEDILMILVPKSNQKIHEFLAEMNTRVV